MDELGKENFECHSQSYDPAPSRNLPPHGVLYKSGIYNYPVISFCASVGTISLDIPQRSDLI